LIPGELWGFPGSLKWTTRWPRREEDGIATVSPNLSVFTSCWASSFASFPRRNPAATPLSKASMRSGKPGFFVIPVRIFGPCAGRAIVSSATITSKNRTEVFVQPTTEHASREYSASSSGRNSDIFRPPSVSIIILMSEGALPCRSPRAGFHSSARWMPTVASNSTVPNTSSVADWNDNMSWPRSRRTIVESSSSSRIRSSKCFHFRSSERLLIRLLDPSSVHDVLTVGSIRKLFTMSLRLPTLGSSGGSEGGNPARNRQPPLTPGQGRRKRKVSAKIISLKKGRWPHYHRSS